MAGMRFTASPGHLLPINYNQVFHLTHKPATPINPIPWHSAQAKGYQMALKINNRVWLQNENGTFNTEGTIVQCEPYSRTIRVHYIWHGKDQVGVFSRDSVRPDKGIRGVFAA